MKLGISLVSSLTFCLVGSSLQSPPASAQITADGTTKTQVNADGNNFTINQGDRLGDNLFHSFERFSVANGGEAAFNNELDIANIFSRVTGSNISNIDGLIRANGAANLYLINPNGIIFGENARLDLGGSFFASTADSLLFEGDIEFSASNPQAPPLLEVNIPIGLGFRDNPGEVVNRSFVRNDANENVGLEVAPGQNLTLVGGDINFERGQATARGGNIELGGLSAAGTVGISDDGSLNFPEAVARADISLSNGADVDVRGTGGGNITINSGNLTLEAGEFGSSFIDAGITADSTSADAQAGNIIVDVAGNITLNDSRIINQVNSGGVGNSGNITISTGSLEATNGGDVDASTFGQGNGGSVKITATDTITFDGEDLEGFNSGVTSLVNSGAKGDAGGVTIDTGSLSLTNGGRVSASTFGQGNAGRVTVNADTILADGEDSDGFQSGIFSNVDDMGVGNGGGIEITTSNLNLTNGGVIVAKTFGQGNGGIIRINATDTISLDGETTIKGFGSAILSGVDNTAVGNAGNIEIKARSLLLEDGGFLSSSTFGKGSAGNVTLNVDRAVTLANNGDIFSNVEKGAVATEAKVGTVTINAGSLAIADGDSSISTSTFGTGDAGNVTLNIDGAVNLTDGDIFSNVGSEAVGNIGNIFIEAKSVSLTDGAQLQAGIFSGGQGEAAGIISIKADDSISFAGTNIEGNRSGIFSDVESEAVGDGSDIKLSANSVFLNNAILKASNAGEGSAGSVVVKAIDQISLTNNSEITSNIGNFDGVLAVGKVGNISLEANELTLSDGAQIEAGFFSNARGEAGIISIKAEESISFEGTNTAIFSNSEVGAVGDGSDIELSANSIALSDGAFLNANNAGQGNAGKIDIQGRSLSLENGGFLTSSIFGKGNAGNITIDVDQTVTLTQDGLIFSTVGENAVGKGGSLDIKTRKLSLNNGAQLSTSTFGEGNAGKITINVKDAATFDGGINNIRSGILSNVDSGAEGNAGDISLMAGSLSLTNGAQIQSGFRGSSEQLPGGRGQGGKVNIDVRDTVTLAGKNDGFSSAIFTDVESGAVGNAGNIEIKARSLSLSNSAELTSSSSGQGNAGSIEVKATDTISLTSNSQITSNVGNFDGVSAVGKVGNISLKANEVTLSDGAQIEAGFFSNARGEAGIISIKAEESISFEGTNTAIFSNSEVGAVGDGSDIELSANSIALSDGAFLNANNAGQGNAGKIDIQGRSLFLETGAQISTSTFGQGNAGQVIINASDIVTIDGEDPSDDEAVGGIFSTVGDGATGNAGGVEITTGNLTLTNAGTINVSTFGQGNAGQVIINASDTISIDGEDLEGFNSGAYSTVASAAEGDAGGVTITTANLTLTNAGTINASTFGQGNAGQVTINASDTISVDGEDSEGFVSGLFSAVNSEAEGDAGGININTSSLSLTNGGIIDASTYGQGNAGDVTVNASESILISGAIEITRSGLFTSAFISSGKGGDINVSTNQLTIKDGGTIEAGNFDSLGVFDPGTGQPGNINIEANSLSLNRGRIEATTQSEIGEAANINLTIAEDIFLKNNSLISARAFDNANGGNVTINADNGSIVAFPNQNNDIVANAEQGNGGNINITTQGIFGLEERPENPFTNDIDASSQFGLQGDFSLNTPENEPIQGLVDLPKNVVNPEDLINQNACKQGAQSKFIVTGKGGLPATPEQMHHSDEVEVGLVKPAMGTAAVIKDLLVAEDATKRIPAKGWIRNEKGEIFLVGYDPTVSNILPQPENLDFCQPRGD